MKCGGADIAWARFDSWVLSGRSIEPTCVFVRANIRADRQISCPCRRACARSFIGLPRGGRSARTAQASLGHLCEGARLP